MRFVQLDEKNEERMNAIRKFTLMDDTFMTQVFSGDKESTQELLRIILKRKDLTVARSATQLTIGNLFGRSVRLDIYATDDAGKQYDIEVQQEDKGAAPERARLNSAMFDSRLRLLVKNILTCLRHISYLLRQMMFWEMVCRFTILNGRFRKPGSCSTTVHISYM